MSELEGWLRALCADQGLAGMTYTVSNRLGVLALRSDDVTLPDDTYRVFLFPAPDAPDAPVPANDVPVRRWGWVDVRPGRLSVRDGERILTMSEVHGEDFPDEPIHPARFVRRLVKMTQTDRLGFVRAVLPGDGAGVHRTITYTTGAAQLQLEGGLWKQTPDAPVYFEPA